MGAGEETECIGGGMFAEDEPGSLVDWGPTWVGECPECGGRFELGYAGILPPHVVVVPPAPV